MAMHWDEQTYYELLEIASNASESEIRQAYQRAKTTYSQDNPALYSIFTKDETRQLLVLIEEAYGILSNQGTRRAYDSRLTHSPFPATQADVHTSNFSKTSQNNNQNKPHPADEFIKNASQNSTIDRNQVQQSQSKPLGQWDSRGQPSRQAQPNRQAQSSSQAQSTKQAHAKSSASQAGTLSITSSSEGGSREDRDVTIVRSLSNPALAVPAGHGRSLSGHYPLNKELENYILETSDTDGPFLSKVRQYKKVEIELMSEKTRISKTYLNAVEKNDYSSLPAPVFVRGFIIQISRALGLDENKTAKGYMEKMKSVKP